MAALIDKSIIPLRAFASSSVAASGTQVSGWIDLADIQALHSVFFVGSGAGTPLVTWQQATSNAGAGAKSVNFSVGTFASSKNEVTIALQSASNLDLAGGFRFVQATVTVTGGAGTLIGQAHFAVMPGYQS